MVTFLPQNLWKVSGTYEWCFVSLWVQFELKLKGSRTLKHCSYAFPSASHPVKLSPPSIHTFRLDWGNVCKNISDKQYWLPWATIVLQQWQKKRLIFMYHMVFPTRNMQDVQVIFNFRASFPFLNTSFATGLRIAFVACWIIPDNYSFTHCISSCRHLIIFLSAKGKISMKGKKTYAPLWFTSITIICNWNQLQMKSAR